MAGRADTMTLTPNTARVSGDGRARAIERGASQVLVYFHEIQLCAAILRAFVRMSSLSFINAGVYISELHRLCTFESRRDMPLEDM